MNNLTRAKVSSELNAQYRLPWVEPTDTKPRPGLAKLFGSKKSSALLWLLSYPTRHLDTELKIADWYSLLKDLKNSTVSKKQLRSKKFKRLPKVVELSDELTQLREGDNLVGRGLALKALATAHLMGVISTRDDFQQWWPLVDELISFSDQLKFDPAESEIHPWLEQLLAVELPLTLVYLLPEHLVQEDVGGPAAEWMAESVTQFLDEDGWPRADLLRVFGPLVSSWARSLKIIRKLKIDFSNEAADQLEWSVRQLLRLMRADGRLMFSGFESESLSEEGLALLLKMSADREDRALAKTSKAKQKSNRTSKKSKRKKMAESSSISEWSESGILQSGWHRNSPKVCFDYSGGSFAVEIGAAKSLIAGNAMPLISFCGNPVLPMDSFEVVCNEHDDDLDYVELQMAMSESVTLNRQIVLSREDEWLVVTDSVLPMLAGAIDYRCDWPMVSGIDLLPESETREIYLRCPKIQSLVLPLALPEWKVGKSPGRLEIVQQESSRPADALTDAAIRDSRYALRMSYAQTGAGICVPLVFDLSPKRSRKKRTWRQLTVAENLKILSSDVAAAYRFQLGQRQWFFYRAISEKGNRTFLGENFNGEFWIGEFDDEGGVKELLRVE